MNKKCLKCGMCCQAIVLSVNHDYFFKSLKEKINNLREINIKNKILNDDLSFILDNWEPISLIEAKKINKNFEKKYFENKSDNFFKCKKYIEGIGCSVYEYRPYICRNFPDKYPNYLGQDDTYGSQCGFYDLFLKIKFLSRDEEIANEIELGNYKYYYSNYKYYYTEKEYKEAKELDKKEEKGNGIMDKIISFFKEKLSLDFKKEYNELGKQYKKYKIKSPLIIF